MARRNEELRSAEQEEATRQVRFDIDDFSRQFPRTNFTATGELRRRRSTLYTMPDVSNDGTTYTMGDEDAQEGDDSPVLPQVQDNANLKDYQDKCGGKQLDNYLYEFSHDGLVEDLDERAEQLATHYGKKTPSMPFLAMTEVGKTAWPKFNGIVDVEQFAKMYEHDPSALFEEVKIRSLLAMAYRGQTEELHRIAIGVSANLRRDHDWSTHFGKKWTEEIDKAKATELHWEEQLRAKDQEIEDLRSTNVTLASRSETQSPREGTLASFTSAGGTRHSRSAKAAEPGTFTNKPEDVDFEHWFMLLKGKLVKNADHYTTESSKINYILGKMGRPAADDLLPFVQEVRGQPAAFNTSQQVLDHLETYYRNPNARDEAHEKYKNLTMANNAIFKTFRLEFVRLAGLSGVPRKEYKRDLNDKIPSRLNERVVEKLDDDDVSFEKFCHVLIQYDNQQHKNFIKKGSTNQRKNNDGGDKNKKDNKKENQPNGPGSKAAANSPATSGGPNFGAHSLGTAPDGTKLWKTPKDMDDRKKLIQQGRCFTCYCQGHVSNVCPRKDDAAKIQAARLNAIVAKTLASNSEKLNKAVAADIGSDSEN